MTHNNTSAKTKKRMQIENRPVIGWREWASFPDLASEHMRVKIDTGAKTSAIHAFRPKLIETPSGVAVRFFIHPRRRRKKPEVLCTAPLLERRIIRSSNGQEEERLVVSTVLRMGARQWPIELTLTNRDAMGFRVLIGRDALEKRFLIDPSGSYRLGKPREDEEREL